VPERTRNDRSGPPAALAALAALAARAALAALAARPIQATSGVRRSHPRER
jgi:hypothetical protein